ncbi:hypothetical protein HaLaN_22863 [Haematococcus lacustris]|uniref:Uncharacterized protein n=1 Tax=Haematococcus lacustris TaxID=44745 RepID=A0A6A0A1F8_HAELA|nr:hypothetical protein HaLaN_22863 [Haematococcus lacustris]
MQARAWQLRRSTIEPDNSDKQGGVHRRSCLLMTMQALDHCKLFLASKCTDSGCRLAVRREGAVHRRGNVCAAKKKNDDGSRASGSSAIEPTTTGSSQQCQLPPGCSQGGPRAQEARASPHHVCRCDGSPRPRGAGRVPAACC